MFFAIYEFVVIMGFWFWLIFVGSSCCIFWAVEEKSGVWATVAFVLAFFLLEWKSEIYKPLSYLRENPWNVFYFSLKYFAIGTAWCVCKWWFYVNGRLHDYEEFKREWLGSRRDKGVVEIEGNKIPGTLKSAWKDALMNNRIYDDGERLGETPQVSRHKDEILSWMSFWPWSMFWTIVKDFIKKIFTSIYYQIRNWMQWISNKIFSKIQDDLT